MITIKNRVTILLLLILIFASFSRLIRLGYPNQYVFDEVYHAYTAKEYLKSNKDAWSPWGKPPPGVAYEWTHPPLAKEIMTVSMFIFRTTDTWAYRLPGALFGVLSVYLVYLLALRLLKNKNAALLAGFVFSLDGLNFVQSRTGMNDIYYVTFFLLALLLTLNKKYLFAAIVLGLALSSKWAAIYSYLIFVPLLLRDRQYRHIFSFILIPPVIYLLSYLPYFMFGYDFSQFQELQKQMWWYHTNLKATHTYSSPWWSWPLTLYPIWYFVDYQKDKIANIFTSGNPVLFWAGSAAILLTTWEAVKKRSGNLLIIISGALIFWLPWAISPRIMFLYHFSPSVPFLCLALGYQLNILLEDKRRRWSALILLALIIFSFLLIYPFLTGIALPKEAVKLFFFFNLSKNPFQ